MMQIVNKIYLPDGDTHFVKQIEKNPVIDGYGTYQYPKFMESLRRSTRRGHAVDVGAHVGLWSRLLAREFKSLTAFEPTPEFADCFELNLANAGNVVFHRCAIGDRSGSLTLSKWAPDIASARASENGDGFVVEMRTLDSFGLRDVDFVKIDVDGWEVFAVKGAEQTIRRDKPVIAIEQKGYAKSRAAEWGYALDILTSWGAQIAWHKGGDYCLTWQ